MVLGGQSPERGEELGGQEQHGKGGCERNLAAHQPDADLDRDQRGRRGGAPFQHERGLEGGSQDVHRRLGVPAPDGLDHGRVLLRPAEHLQRRQPAQHVEEVRARPRELALAASRRVPDPAPDQPEEQHEDRSRDDQDQDRPGIEHEDRCGHDGRDDGRQDPGGTEPSEPRPEALDAIAGEPDEVTRSLAAERHRPHTEHRRRDLTAERPHERGGGCFARPLARSREHRPKQDQPQQQDDPLPDIRGIGMIEEDVIDHAGQDDDRREPREHRSDATDDTDARAEPSRAVHPPEPAFDEAAILSSYRATA